MSKISAIVIGYNEAKYIKRCLNNCAQWADEIVYVDSFSTDGSDEYPKADFWYNGSRTCQMKFIQHRYDNTRDQRNRALEAASHDWRFILDVDEYLSENAIEKLPSILETCDEHQDIRAVRFERHNFVDAVDMGQEGIIHMVKRGVLHGGHPLHADRAAGVDRRDIIVLGQKVIHQKTAVQWMERARIYWWMCPYTFAPNWTEGMAGQAEATRPPGSEDLEPPHQNWWKRDTIDVMTEFMDAGLDKRLTPGYLEKMGLEITPKGWGRKK